MTNPHPSPYAPRGTAPPSSVPDPTLAAKRDAEAMQRAIKRVQAHHENLQLSPEDFAQRFGSRIMNSATEFTVEQIFAQLDVDVGALSKHQLFLCSARSDFAVEHSIACLWHGSPDGVVSANELGAFKEMVPESNWSHDDFVKRFGHHVPEESHRSVFDELDEDDDGLLSQEEKMGINAKILGGSNGLHKPKTPPRGKAEL